MRLQSPQFLGLGRLQLSLWRGHRIGLDPLVQAVLAHVDSGVVGPGRRPSSRSACGERQRIAIARALLVGAPTLVLDEATASLDVQSEEAIGTTIGLLKHRGRTVVLIAHRPSTIRHADRVVLLTGRPQE